MYSRDTVIISVVAALLVQAPTAVGRVNSDEEDFVLDASDIPPGGRYHFEAPARYNRYLYATIDLAADEDYLNKIIISVDRGTQTYTLYNLMMPKYTSPDTGLKRGVVLAGGYVFSTHILIINDNRPDAEMHPFYIYVRQESGWWSDAKIPIYDANFLADRTTAQKGFVIMSAFPHMTLRNFDINGGDKLNVYPQPAIVHPLWYRFPIERESSCKAVVKIFGPIATVWAEEDSDDVEVSCTVDLADYDSTYFTPGALVGYTSPGAFGYGHELRNQKVNATFKMQPSEEKTFSVRAEAIIEHPGDSSAANFASITLFKNNGEGVTHEYGPNSSIIDVFGEANASGFQASWHGVESRVGFLCAAFTTEPTATGTSNCTSLAGKKVKKTYWTIAHQRAARLVLREIPYPDELLPTPDAVTKGMIVISFLLTLTAIVLCLVVFCCALRIFMSSRADTGTAQKADTKSVPMFGGAHRGYANVAMIEHY